jgi:hypothetical protein
MGFVSKMTANLLGLAILAGCTATDGRGVRNLPEGEQIDIRDLAQLYEGKTGCINYEPSTNSCSSLVTGRVSGDVLETDEIFSILNPATGKPEIVALNYRSKVEDGGTCLSADGVKVGTGSKKNLGFATRVMAFSRRAIRERGGVCRSYFQAEDGYVIVVKGGDGKPFPPGDMSIQVATGTPSLRSF